MTCLLRFVDAVRCSPRALAASDLAASAAPAAGRGSDRVRRSVWPVRVDADAPPLLLFSLSADA